MSPSFSPSPTMHASLCTSDSSCTTNSTIPGILTVGLLIAYSVSLLLFSFLMSWNRSHPSATNNKYCQRCWTSSDLGTKSNASNPAMKLNDSNYKKIIEDLTERAKVNQSSKNLPFAISPGSPGSPGSPVSPGSPGIPESVELSDQISNQKSQQTTRTYTPNSRESKRKQLQALDQLQPLQTLGLQLEQPSEDTDLKTEESDQPDASESKENPDETRVTQHVQKNKKTEEVEIKERSVPVQVPATPESVMIKNDYDSKGWWHEIRRYWRCYWVALRYGWDWVTDIAVILEFGLLYKKELDELEKARREYGDEMGFDEDNYDPCPVINPFYLFVWSIVIFVNYRIVSGLAIAYVTNKPIRFLTQLMDVEFFRAIWVNYKANSQSPCNPQRWIQSLEAVLESTPQAFIQLFYIAKTSSCREKLNPVIVFSLVWSIISIASKSTSEDKSSFQEQYQRWQGAKLTLPGPQKSLVHSASSVTELSMQPSMADDADHDVSRQRSITFKETESVGEIGVGMPIPLGRSASELKKSRKSSMSRLSQSIESVGVKGYEKTCGFLARIEPGYLARHLYRVVDVTYRISMFVLSWIIFGGFWVVVGAAFELFVVGLFLLRQLTKPDPIKLKSVLGIIYTLASCMVWTPIAKPQEDSIARFMVYIRGWRKASNSLIVISLWVFGFVNFDCEETVNTQFVICNPFVIRHSYFIQTNWVIILLVYCSLCSAVFDLATNHITEKMIDQSKPVALDRSLVKIAIGGDWNDMYELLLFGVELPDEVNKHELFFEILTHTGPEIRKVHIHLGPKKLMHLFDQCCKDRNLQFHQIDTIEKCEERESMFKALSSSSEDSETVTIESLSPEQKQRDVLRFIVLLQNNKRYLDYDEIIVERIWTDYKSEFLKLNPKLLSQLIELLNQETWKEQRLRYLDIYYEIITECDTPDNYNGDKTEHDSDTRDNPDGDSDSNKCWEIINTLTCNKAVRVLAHMISSPKGDLFNEKHLSTLPELDKVKTIMKKLVEYINSKKTIANPPNEQLHNLHENLQDTLKKLSMTSTDDRKSIVESSQDKSQNFQYQRSGLISQKSQIISQKSEPLAKKTELEYQKSEVISQKSESRKDLEPPKRSKTQTSFEFEPIEENTEIEDAITPTIIRSRNVSSDVKEIQPPTLEPQASAARARKEISYVGSKISSNDAKDKIA